MILGRDRELEQIDVLLERARNGHGAVALLEGSAGIGKTALLVEATRRAESSGLVVLRGGGAPLERDYAFGVVRQLFAPTLGSGSGSARMFEGAARLAAIPLGLAQAPDELAAVSSDTSAAMHGLFWLTANLAEGAPLLMAIDDAHWGDAMSLRFALYLARRVDDLPALLLIATRPIVELGDNELLIQLGTLPGVTRLRPDALNEADVARLIEQHRLHDPHEQFVAACFRATGGNPFLLAELLDGLVANGASGSAADADRVAGFAPEGIVRWVLGRLGALTLDARELAAAFAVLGPVPLADAGALANLASPGAGAAADELVGAHILTVGRGYEFVHPVLQAAVYDSLAPAKRSEAHARAARLSSARGAPPGRVAAHLLACDPGHDDWAVEVLRSAAREASASGAPAFAGSYLERALMETQEAAIRAELLLELGEAQLQAGVAGAIEHLREALEAGADSRQQAKTLLTLARALFSTGDYIQAREALRLGLAKLPSGDDDLSLELSGWSIALAREDAGLPAVTKRQLEALIEGDAPGRTRSERLLLVHLAYEAVRSGARPSHEVARLAQRALSHGALLKDSAADVMGPYGGACYSLLYAGHLDEAIAELRPAIELSQRRGSRVAFGRLSRLRGIAHYLRGDLAEAMADLDSARTTHSDGYEHGLPETTAFLALCRLDRDDLAGAAAVLELEDTERWRSQPSLPSYLFALGRTRAAQGSLDAGFRTLLECEQLIRETNSPNPAVNLPWRSEAGLLAARLGSRRQAEKLIAEEVRLARAFGEPRALGVALRAAGLLAKGADGLEQLAEAVALLERARAWLELARTLTDQGASLRRGGRRRDAREPLRRALDLATRCGAHAISRRAREELTTAGAKPRRERISGVEALTASELRVAQLAAQGLTNRQIAQALFITMSTVSAHLGHAYAKLDISDRADLDASLSAERVIVRP